MHNEMSKFLSFNSCQVFFSHIYCNVIFKDFSWQIREFPIKKINIYVLHRFGFLKKMYFLYFEGAKIVYFLF